MVMTCIQHQYLSIHFHNEMNVYVKFMKCYNVLKLNILLKNFDEAYLLNISMNFPVTC